MNVLFENPESSGDHDHRLIVKNVQHKGCDMFCIEIEGVRRGSMSYILRESDIIELYHIFGAILSGNQLSVGNNQPIIELPQ